MAYDIDSSSKYLRVTGSMSVVDTPLTVSMAVYPHTTPGTTYTIWQFYQDSTTNGMKVDVQMNSSNQVVLTQRVDALANNASVTSTATVTLNAWNYIVAVLGSGGASRTIYVNSSSGDTDSTNLGSVGSPFPTGDFLYYGIGSGGGISFDGLIGPTCFWSNAALTSTEVAGVVGRVSPQLIRTQDIRAYHKVDGRGTTSELAWLDKLGASGSDAYSVIGSPTVVAGPPVVEAF